MNHELSWLIGLEYILILIWVLEATITPRASDNRGVAITSNFE